MSRAITNSISQTGHSSLHLALMSGVATLALTLGASPALGQTASAAATPAPTTAATPADGSGLQEIVVTAQKRSENAQNVPIAITALNAKQLSAAGVTDTSDLKLLTPSLGFNTALGGFGQPRIRGVGTTTTGPGIENPVATYVDGVYIGSAAGTLFALNDVEQVAVLKGPQGTLFGRNATGGLIQVSTRAPSDTPTADASVTYGNYNTVGSSAYLSGGLTDTLSASLAGIYDNQQDGFGKNIYNNLPVQLHHDYAGRGKLQWNPESATKFTLSADYSYLQGAEPAIRPLDGTLLGTPSPGGPRDIDQNVQPFLQTRQWGVSLTSQHDFSGVQLLSITAYRNSYLHAIIDGDQTPLSLVAVDQTQKDKQFSQEVQLLSTAPGPFKWVAGAYYYWSQGAYDPLQTTITESFGNIISTIESRQKLNSYAAFAQGTYELAPSTHLTAGLRYTIDDRSIDANSDTATPFGPTLASTEASKSFKKLTWRLSLDHRFSPELLGYISYNRGFKSGSFVPQVIPAEELKPETLDAFEVGLKSDLLDRRIRLNAAAFYYNYQNIQINEILDGVLYPFDGSGARSYGIDADATVKVTRGLTLTFGASYIHDRYKSFPNGYTTTTAIDPTTFQFTVISPYNSTGNRLQDTPDWTANVGASYQLGSLLFSGTYYYNDGYYVDPGNKVREPHYNVVDASITWTSSDSHLFVKVWGKNLTNALYSDQLDATSTGNNQVAAPPRTYGVTAGFHF